MHDLVEFMISCLFQGVSKLSTFQDSSYQAHDILVFINNLVPDLSPVTPLELSRHYDFRNGTPSPAVRVDRLLSDRQLRPE